MDEELDRILYLKDICLSDEQMVSLRRVIDAMSVFCISLQEIVSNIFQEQIKPIVNVIKEFMDEDEHKPIAKIKYGIIKEIKPNQYLGLNKPKAIHCRSNC